MEIFNYKFEDLFNPVLKALHILGGSGSVDEIEENVIQLLDLSEAKVNDIHRGNITKLSYRLAWARNYLKRCGLLENSSRGVWALTAEGHNTHRVDPEDVKRRVREMSRGESIEYNEEIPGSEIETELNVVVGNTEISQLSWQESLLEIVKALPPERFERLSQRLLRELGFQNVEVTGKSGDGGIDGKGVYRVGGVMSFHIVFQCKRYSGTVSPSVIRDFRGAFIGRADKGLIITTGSFTREAKKEAQRDGAPPIDLMDGLELAEKIKELRLGVRVEMVEKVTLIEDWFNNF